MCRWSDSNWWHTNGSTAAVFFIRAEGYLAILRIRSLKTI